MAAIKYLMQGNVFRGPLYMGIPLEVKKILT